MQGLTHLLRDLSELQSDLTPGTGGRTDTLLSKMAHFTEQYAMREYDNHPEALEEVHDFVSGDVAIDGDTAIITAEHPKILFIEFGTGINKNDGSLSRVAGEYGFTPAMWSVSHSQWLLPPKAIRHKGWWPIPGTYGQGVNSSGKKDSLWTEGHQPVDAMYKAFNALVANYPEFAREIFK